MKATINNFTEGIDDRFKSLHSKQIDLQAEMLEEIKGVDYKLSDSKADKSALELLENRVEDVEKSSKSHGIILVLLGIAIILMIVKICSLESKLDKLENNVKDIILIEGNLQDYTDELNQSIEDLLDVLEKR